MEPRGIEFTRAAANSSIVAVDIGVAIFSLF
jgi:hypothetical protein